jgi:hypothetical protein
MRIWIPLGGSQEKKGARSRWQRIVDESTVHGAGLANTVFGIAPRQQLTSADHETPPTMTLASP